MPNKKGYIPWNKGLSADDERVKKYCYARKINFSDEQKNKQNNSTKMAF